MIITVFNFLEISPGLHLLNVKMTSVYPAINNNGICTLRSNMPSIWAVVVIPDFEASYLRYRNKNTSLLCQRVQKNPQRIYANVPSI